MAKLIGISDIGPWVSKRYIDRYGISTKWARQFVNRDLLIRTDKGLWRDGARGYTFTPADAGRFPFDVAWSCIKDLGPEKQSILILPQPVKAKGKQRIYTVHVRATLEIPARSVEEAQEAAEYLTAPLHYPEGTFTMTQPALSDA